jgi:hypothetical protein
MKGRNGLNHRCALNFLPGLLAGFDLQLRRAGRISLFSIISANFYTPSTYETVAIKFT